MTEIMTLYTALKAHEAQVVELVSLLRSGISLIEEFIATTEKPTTPAA